jgi:anti-sigma factor RsiW
MEKVDLEKVLRERTANGRGHDWRCPSETQLAGYVDHTLDAKARALFETHLAACTACIEQVAFLLRASDWPESAEVPIQLLNRARSLVPEKPKASLVWNWRWVPVTVAALLLIAITGVIAMRALRSRNSPLNREPLVAQSQSPQQPLAVPTVNRSTNTPSPQSTHRREPSPEPSTAVVRNGEPASQTPKLIFPTEGASVRRAAVELRWRPVSGAMSYEASVVTVSGDTIFSHPTSDTHVSIPTESLTSGATYFATIRAHFSDGRTTRSILVSFKIID